MSHLDHIQFRLSLNTTKNDPIKELFEPALSTSNRYDIAVGYFTSAWVRDAATGLTKFALNNGKARWVISPEISPEDLEAIQGTDPNFNENISSLISASFQKLFDALTEDTRTALSWLVRDQVLKFKVAIPQNKLSGLMHAKMGVFSDETGNKLGFSGSYNLTGAAATNWEKIDIFCGWRSDESSQRICEIQSDFDNMWNGDDDNLAIYDVTELELSPFIDKAKHSSRPYKIKSKDNNQCPSIPIKFLDDDGNLRKYQAEAISNWFKSNGRGILAMATGSGKTVTALSAATKLAKHAVSIKSKILIIALAPYQHLAEQWNDEAREFSFNPILCYGGTEKWINSAQRALTEFRAGTQNIVFLIVVNDTFTSTVFQSLINEFQSRTMLIADEMHNLGAKTYLNALPPDVQFRLGLSATPIRHGDEEGTKGLEDYFGNTVFEFTLEDAINAEFLCKYYYYPVLCPLNQDEMDEYRSLSLKIARLFVIGSKDSNSEEGERLQKLLIERARLLGRVESKITNLKRLMADRTEATHNLVYCSDTKTDAGRQVEEVVRMLGKELKQKTAKFTADESPKDRKQLIERFGSGDLQTLVAIRCLDEGVDIPRTETAYILASSSNPRQYIQRRGRVLRKAKGKTYAYIYDFIAIPNMDSMSGLSDNQLKIEKRLVQKELVRVNEFVDLSLNSGDALLTMREIRRKLNITEI